MKKWLLVLGMITCMMGLCACGQAKEVTPFISQADAESIAEMNITNMNQIVVLGAQNQLSSDLEIAAVESWEKALVDMGSYEGIISVESSFDEKDGVINATVQGSDHNAIVEFVFDDETLTTITTNVEYTFAEKMEKAALNTLLGMGTVFVVLILISLIISCFGLIPKIQNMFSKKAKEEEIKAEAIDNTIAQIVEKEELADDLELVAVIAAAIAASEGAASTDGFVVRSIKRRKTRA